MVSNNAKLTAQPYVSEAHETILKAGQPNEAVDSDS